MSAAECGSLLKSYEESKAALTLLSCVIETSEVLTALGKAVTAQQVVAASELYVRLHGLFVELHKKRGDGRRMKILMNS